MLWLQKQILSEMQASEYWGHRPKGHGKISPIDKLIALHHSCPRQHLSRTLCIQIWTALIALLLLNYLQQLSKFVWSISNLATMLWLNLFTFMDFNRDFCNSVKKGYRGLLKAIFCDAADMPTKHRRYLNSVSNDSTVSIIQILIFLSWPTPSYLS